MSAIATLVRIIGLAALLLTAGCNQPFHLNRIGEPPESPWPYGRLGIDSRAAMDSPYEGGLNLKWETRIGEGPIGPLTIGAGRLIIPTTRARAYLFNLETGHREGRQKTRGNCQGGLLVHDSLLFLAVGPDHNSLSCYNLHSRSEIWEVPVKDVSGPPIIVRERIIFTTAERMAECRDLLTGNAIWQTELPARSPAGPSSDGEVIYIPLENGLLAALNEKDGAMKFTVETNEPLISKAAVGDLVFVAGAEGSLCAIERNTGDIIWRKSFDWPVWTAPAVDNVAVYLGDSGGFLHALDRHDGHTLWTFKSDGVVVASPVVVGKFVLFASLDKNLYCVDKSSGLLVSRWKTKNEVRFSPISDGRNIFLATQGGTIQCLGD